MHFRPAPKHSELMAEIKRLAVQPDLPKGVEYSERLPDEIRIDRQTYFLHIESAYSLERLIERITPKARKRRKA